MKKQRNGMIDIRVKKETVKAMVNLGNESFVVYPFDDQPITFSYDKHGYERINAVKKIVKTVRFYASQTGDYSVTCYDCDGTVIEIQTVPVVAFKRQRPLQIKNGFAYLENGEYYLPIGINLAYPESFKDSSGEEFCTTDKVCFLGIRQYENWIKQCAKNGANLIRIWAGSAYFSPDKEELGKYDYSQFSKLDKIFELANQYNIRIKLTIEKFRHFVSHPRNNAVEGLTVAQSIFEHYHTYNGEVVTDIAWLSQSKYKKLWCVKLLEYAKRYAGNPALYAVEFWNEMNCYGYGLTESNMKLLNDWNAYMEKQARELFPNVLLLNSFGSLDSPEVDKLYQAFNFEIFDWIQFHSYLDQGAGYNEVQDSPIEAIKKSSSLLLQRSKRSQKPLFLAETGAVNDCHSGEFRYYAYDNDGLIFVDSVYTPLFLGCIGTGNMWHWDKRYVASKNLYKYFKPISQLVSRVDFCKENFESHDLSNEKFYCFVLKGKTKYLAFIRNKDWDWKNVLRDCKKVKLASGKIPFFEIGAKSLNSIKIWTDEKANVCLNNNTLILENLGKGLLLKGEV